MSSPIGRQTARPDAAVQRLAWLLIASLKVVRAIRHANIGSTLSFKAQHLFILALSLTALRSHVSTAAESEPDEGNELAPVVVTSTRTPTLVQDEPLRVEAVPTEEIEENLTEAPGDLSALFKELPGVHVQSSAPGLGGASMQLRGMPDRDTLVLMDGLPLLNGEP